MNMNLPDGYAVRRIRTADDAVMASIIRTVMPSFGAVGSGFAIYDPEVFAVGGAISQQNLFIESLIRNVDSIYNRLPFTAPRAKVVPCRFRNASNLVGALYHHLATADPSCCRLETNG